MIETIAGYFGNLTISRVKKHKFLGIYIDYLTGGKLSLFMKDYIEESIDLFGEYISTKVSSPENQGMQNVDESSKILYKKDADILHSIVEKILWVAKMVRPNIGPSVLVLCTRVTNSTKEGK